MFKVCTVFGGMVSTSDAVPRYSAVMLDRLCEAVSHRGSRLFKKRVRELTEEPDGSLRVVYDLQGERREALLEKPPTD